MIAVVMKRKKSNGKEDKTPSKRPMIFNPYTWELVPTIASSTPSRSTTSTPNVVTAAKNLPAVTPAPTFTTNKTRSVVDAEATDDESDDIHQISSCQLDYMEKSIAITMASATTIFVVARCR